MSAGWDFPHVDRLWDPRIGAINAAGDRLEALDAEERAASLTVLVDQVTARVRGMEDGALVNTAYFMVEDLFKSIFHGLWWSTGTEEYIRVTTGAVMQELSRRDFVLHYIIDNQECEAKLADRLDGVPLPFWAAGLLVTGPQQMALELMEKADGLPRDVRALPLYRDEGLDVANQLIQWCHRERRSSVYLNIDLDDDAPPLSLDVARSAAGTPGAIVIVRNEAPTIGSFAYITPPPGVTLPRG
ncbi:hypothetical protein [Mycobacterium sp. pW045]|uniref:hypothetical protein n=1 Tax=Mycobacterium sp. pW045 TaxID=3238984 RepID=UPI00351B1CD0